jgi:hypothetical protein
MPSLPALPSLLPSPPRISRRILRTAPVRVGAVGASSCTRLSIPGYGTTYVQAACSDAAAAVVAYPDENCTPGTGVAWGGISQPGVCGGAGQWNGTDISAVIECQTEPCCGTTAVIGTWAGCAGTGRASRAIVTATVTRRPAVHT